MLARHHCPVRNLRVSFFGQSVYNVEVCIRIQKKKTDRQRERKLEVQVERGRGWQAASQELEIAGEVEFRVAKQGGQGEHSQTRRRSRSRTSRSKSPLPSQAIQRRNDPREPQAPIAQSMSSSDVSSDLLPLPQNQDSRLESLSR